MQYRIHSGLYKAADARRRKEWELALRDLNHDAPAGGPTLTVYKGKGDGVQLLLASPASDPTIVELAEGDLLPHFSAYGDIIARIAHSTEGDGARSLETLDYAKKLVHDEAGEFLQEALEALLTLELTQARRLFTLIFLVGTHLPERLVTFHRRHS